MIVAKIMLANVVPPVLAPKINDEKDGPELLSQRLTKLFDKLDLLSILRLDTRRIKMSVHKLMEENQNIFALNDLELGKTSLVKHHIQIRQSPTF